MAPPSGADPSEDDDEFTDVSACHGSSTRGRFNVRLVAQVEDVLPASPILPGQQTPTAFTHAAVATPRASSSSILSDNVRRYAWPTKDEPPSGIRRPRFASKTSFQEVRYRKNNVQRSDTGERDRTGNGHHTKGLAPRPVDFAMLEPKRRPGGQPEASRPTTNSAASVNRYSLLDGSPQFEDDYSHNGAVRGTTKELEFGAAPLLKMTSPPLLIRKATYSSLPPSPSALSSADFEVDVTGPRSVTEGPSYLENYDHIDQEAFAQALQKVLESKKDIDLEERGITERKFRAASLPPEDVATERADPEFIRPEVEYNNAIFLNTPPPLSRTASRMKSDSPQSPHEQSNAQPFDDPGTSPLETEKRRRTLQPLWQMITDEMNVEQNRLFVIEGKWCAPCFVCKRVGQIVQPGS